MRRQARFAGALSLPGLKAGASRASKVNSKRAKLDLPPHRIHEDAYRALPEDELMFNVRD